jgi:hypothetical protein
MNYSTAKKKVYHLLLMPPKPTKKHASKLLAQKIITPSVFLALYSSKPSLEQAGYFFVF